MASVETSGPTIDDAIDAALEQLDLDEDQVELQVLSEGGDGQPARVRATPRSEVEATSERTDEVSRSRRDRRHHRVGDGRNALVRFELLKRPLSIAEPSA